MDNMTIYLILRYLFCIVSALCITYCAVAFDNTHLLWWFVPILILGDVNFEYYPIEDNNEDNDDN